FHQDPVLQVPFAFLPDLKCYDSQNSKQQTDDPETGHYLGFSKSLHLIMVVQGSHFEYPPAFAIFTLCIFEIAYLNDHRKALDKEHPAKYGKQQFYPYQY